MRCTTVLGVLLLFLVSFAACGSSSSVPLAVTALVPGTLDSEIPTAIEVQGVKFGAAGEAVTVRLEAVTGTPFTGGTAAGVDLPGTVRSDTRIDATTVLFGVTGAVQVRVIVILGTEETSGPGGPEVTVTGPQVTGSQPSVFLASNPAEMFTLEGRGFTPIGQLVNVRLTAVSGSPFRIIGAWSNTLDLDGEILSDTQVRCTMPGSVVSESTVAHVEVQYAGRWITAEQGPELFLLVQTKIVPDDGEVGDRFGSSVAIEGDTAVFAARHTDDMAPGAGSAYVFVKSGTAWIRQQELTASDGDVYNELGTDVALSGNSVVVGASQVSAAYVFVRSGTTWTQQQKLTVADGGASAFGWSVTISGNTIVVGAPLDDDPDTHAGSAYVFTRSGTTWTQQQKLLAPGGAFRDMFGTDVAVLGDTALVGAMGDSQEADFAGSAHVFVRNGTTWTPQQKIVAWDAAEDDGFGVSVALSSDRAVIGADEGDGAVTDSGAVYVFTRSGSTWPLEQKLHSTIGGNLWNFGKTVAIWANRILIGAPWDRSAPSGAGAAYVFRPHLGTWKQQQRLTPSDGVANDWFGTAVAIDGGRALVGSSHHNVYGDQSGAAYIH